MIYHYRFIPNNLTYYPKISDGRRIKKKVTQDWVKGLPSKYNKSPNEPSLPLMAA